MTPEEITMDIFDYPLPEERIAKRPLAARDTCLLLCAGTTGSVTHTTFDRLPQLLTGDSLLVCNNTRVINARMLFKKPTGATIELFLLSPDAPADYQENFAQKGGCRWKCLVGNLKRWHDGDILTKQAGPYTLHARLDRSGTELAAELSWTPAEAPFAEVVEEAGFIPIPPYLNRDTEPSDAVDYQTVYSAANGSVAAPTAGLHFTPAVLTALEEKGIKRREVTLHVGAGTFKPVKSETLGGHEMHTEHFVVSRTLIEELITALEQHLPIVATGTTTVRTLESLPYLGLDVLKGNPATFVGQWAPYRNAEFSTIDALQALLRHPLLDEKMHASTAILIAPGFKWRLTNRLITNFHQPQSTLLLLIDSFLGGNGRWRDIYSEALAGDYRFLSYGDACLFDGGAAR